MNEHDRRLSLDGSGVSAARYQPETARAALTARQVEVALLIAQGYTNADIGARLGLDQASAAEEVERLRAALGAPNRLQVAIWALHYRNSAADRSTAPTTQ